MPERATKVISMEEKMVEAARASAKKTATVAKSVVEKPFSTANIIKRLLGK